jgi:hypothetical protein
VFFLFGKYFLLHDQEFKAAKPHELGSIMQGWTAILAAIWLAATVYLQGLQIRETAEGMQRSIKELERNAVESQARALKSRLFFSIRRLLKLGEDHDCYLSKGEERTSLIEMIGDRSEFEELSEAGELGEALSRIADGISGINEKLDRDWLLHEEVVTVKRLMKELDNMKATAEGIRGMSAKALSIECNENIPDVHTLDCFVAASSSLRDSLEKMSAMLT